MSTDGGKNGNGEKALQNIPYLYGVWYFFRTMGLKATVVLVLLACFISSFGLWFYKCAIPESEAKQRSEERKANALEKQAEAQSEFLKQAAKNQQRVADCIDRITVMEQQQSEWQILWKHEIEAEHAKRAMEAKELISRCEEQAKFHEKQLKAMDVIVEKLDKSKPTGGG